MSEKFSNLVIVDHPLLKDKLTRMRDSKIPPAAFRGLLKEIAALMTYETCRHFATMQREVQTPLEKMTGEVLDREIAVVPVLRAGLGMIDGVLSIIPEARIGMLGLYRDENTLQPVDYYLNLPANLSEKEIILVDPMLATGGSAVAAASSLKKHGARHLNMMALIAAPEGVEAMNKNHPDVKVYTAVLDRQLDKNGYILPGLGDAGDRCFGTTK